MHAGIPGNNEIKSHAAALYRPYLMQQIAAASPGVYADWWEVPGNIVGSDSLVDGASTYYEFYRDVERAESDLQIETATDGHSGRAGGTEIIPQDPTINPGGFGAFGIQTGAINYPAAYGPTSMGLSERRKRRVTVVNCGASEDYATATGETGGGYGDTFMGEVVDVVDVLLLTPPQVQACDPAMASDPQNNHLCDNSDVTDVDLDVELVDAASINAVNFDARFYAVLVH